MSDDEYPEQRGDPERSEDPEHLDDAAQVEDAGPLEDPDDLANYRTPFSRLVTHARGWLGLLVAIAVALPLAGWAIDELDFRRSGDTVAQRLGADASLVDALLLVRVSTCAGGSSSGSAFAVDLGDGPVVVTNRHVVDEASAVGVRPLVGGPALSVSEVRLSADLDVAVLELSDPRALPATLVAGPDAAVGDEVRLVGFPAARPFTTEGEVVEVAPSRLLLDLRTDPGASGSPVVDDEGRVVGQIWARTVDGQGVATPISAVARAVEQATPAPGC